MSEKDIVRILASARFKFRSDTLQNWQTENPVLLSGEFGVVTNGTETEKVKIGDGVTPWNELGWWKGPKGEKGEPGATTNGAESFHSANSITYGENMVALGSASSAGCMGYYIKSIDRNLGRIVLTKEKIDIPIFAHYDSSSDFDDSFETPAYETGDVFSIINHNHYPLCGTITSVDHNIISYVGSLPFTEFYEDTEIDGHVLFVPTKPEVGAVAFTFATLTIGKGNKGSGSYGLVVGRDNILCSDQGFIFGNRNRGGYSGMVGGTDNDSTGNHTVTTGEKNINRGYNTRMHGKGLINTKGQNQDISGLYNIDDTKNSYVEIVGNGKNADNRSNARTQSWNGDSWVAGNVYFGGTSVEDPNANRAASIKEVVGIIRSSFSVPPKTTILRKNGALGDTSTAMTITQRTRDDIVYDHIAINTSSTAEIKYNKYGINPIPIVNQQLYIKLLMRTNMANVKPAVTLLGGAQGVGHRLSNTASKGSGQWEQFIIAYERISTSYKSTNQIHVKFAGANASNGSTFKGTDYAGKLGTDGNPPYFDVAGYCFFDNLSDAQDFDFEMDAKVTISSLNVGKSLEEKANKDYVDTQLGDIETALDNIIAIQENLIGGGNV